MIQNKSVYLKKLFNMLNRKIKKHLNTFNQVKLEKKYRLIPNNKAIKSDGTTLLNNQNIADEFGKSLANIFSTSTIISKSFEPAHHLDQNYPEITYEEFINPLVNSNIDAAPGIDKINNKTLKNCPTETLIHIHTIFEASLKLKCVSKIWKSSKITMIHKKGKPIDELQSYRPISLINCISKWLEKIV